MRLDEKIKARLAPILKWYNGLTARERNIIIICVVFIGGLGIHQKIYLPIREAFASQSEQVENVKRDIKTLPHVLNRYSKLIAKKNEIESEYKEVEISEGERTFLEKVVQEKVGGASGLDINLGPVQAFGGSYEQAPFSVKFYTANLQSVIDFLTEIISGKKRLLLTKIDITKSRAGDRLEVGVDVSSIRKTAR